MKILMTDPIRRTAHQMKIHVRTMVQDSAGPIPVSLLDMVHATFQGSSPRHVVLRLDMRRDISGFRSCG